MPFVNLRRTALLVVDAQHAFGDLAASLKLQTLARSERSELRAMSQMMDGVHRADGTVFLIQDWHHAPGTQVTDGHAFRIDDRAIEEFAIYDPHALAGSLDARFNATIERKARLLERREGQPRSVIPVDAWEPVTDQPYRSTAFRGAERLVVARKDHYDVTRRVDFDGSVGPHQLFLDRVDEVDPDAFVVLGKIAEVCVKGAVESLRRRYPHKQIVVVPEGISSLRPGLAEQLGLPNKQQVMDGFREQGVAVASMDDLLNSERMVW